MKKFFVMAIAAMALTFVSCSEQPNSANVPTAEEVEKDPATAADGVVKQLQDIVKNAKAEDIKPVLEKVQEVAAQLTKDGKLEKVEQFLTTIQQYTNGEEFTKFVEANKEKVGDIATLLNPVAAAEDVVENATDAANEVAGEANDAVDAVVDAVENAPDAAVEAANAQVEAAKAAADAQVEAAKAAANAELDKVRNAVPSL